MWAAVTEKQLQQAIVECARLLGWRVYHTFDSRRSEPGFPDLCMVRGHEIVFAELKTANGKVTAAQQDWLDAFALAFCDVRVWRPADWVNGTVEDVLRAPVAQESRT